MQIEDNEEKSLRSAAFQNARSIIAARRRAEDALRRKTEQLAHSLSMLRATLEATTDGILATDESGGVTEFNANFVQMWRVPGEIVEARNERRLFDYIASELAEPVEFLATLRDIAESAPAQTSHTLDCADGRVFELHTNLQRNGNQVMGRVWSFRDITARRWAEEELQQQREWFQVTLSSIADAVITTDTETRVTFLNPVAENMTGWATAEARGQPLEQVFNIIDEETRESLANAVRGVLSEDVIVGLAQHTILIAKNGAEIAIDNRAAPIKDTSGNITGAVMVFQDVTERRKAERSLQSSEKLLTEFFENAAVGLHWVGPDGRVLRANRTELKLLGYSEDEYVGHHVSEFHEDSQVIEDILRRLSCGDTLENYEARLRCKDGSIRDVLISSNVLWQDGKFIHTRCFTRDITELKRAEDARAHLAAVVESSDDAILSKTLDGVITSWNRGAERMFGYTADEMIGQSVTLLMPPDRVNEEPGILQRLRRGERIESYETVRRRKDGSLFDVSLTVSPIRDASGKIIGASKIARDVTSRKQAEAAVRASEVRFRQLADAMPQIVWTADAKGQTEYSNRRWYEFTGFPEGTASDESFLSILHPDDLQKCRDLWMQSVRTGQPYQIEYRFRNRAGEYRWHLGRALPARNAADEIVRWYGSSTDIHEQKLTAEALREKHAVTEQLNNVARALATELDLKKIVQIITDAGTRAIRAQFGAFLQGHSGEDGRSSDLDTFSGASRDAFGKFSQPREKEILRETLRGTGIIRLDDARLHPQFATMTLGEDQALRDLPVASYLAVPVIARSGEVLGGLFFGHVEPGVFKEHDEKIVLALASQAAAAMNTARLYLAEQQARAAAEEANRIKDDFLAALSHELRTPLTPVLAILSTVKEDTSLPPELAADLEIVRRNVELETRLIDDLLDLTRISRGKLELNRERVAISQLIENAITTCLPDLRAKEFTVIRDLERPEQTVFADSARVTQVLWNLLKNSIKFTPEGGTITVRSRIVSGDEGEQITIAVEDSGMGVEPERLEHVFDAFEQGGRKITRQFGGLGLGLAISKAIAEAHRGTILGASEGQGRGSTFTLVLPLGPIETTQPAAAPSRVVSRSTIPQSENAHAYSRPLRILLVEDHVDTAAIVVRLLNRSGHEVIHADTIADALQKAETEAGRGGIDLVMSDLGLPDGSGLELMRELSTKYGLRGIALTGFGMESDRQQSAAAGFSHHLTKPVNIAALRTIIAEMTKNQ